MRFLKFIVGGLLILASIFIGIGLIFGGTFTIITQPGSFWPVVGLGVLDFIIFLSGVYLMKP